MYVVYTDKCRSLGSVVRNKHHQQQFSLLTRY